MVKTLFPVDIAVDANRDGTIKFVGDFNDPSVAGKLADKTTQEKPFRFWVNEDQDTVVGGEPQDVEVLNQTYDWKGGSIGTVRDLEDFSRLHLYIGGLQEAIKAGQIKVGLEWKSVTEGNPSIQIFKAYESDGGLEYLKDDHIAQFQQADEYHSAITNAAPNGNPLEYRVKSGTPYIFPASVFQNLDTNTSNIYLRPLQKW